MLPLWLALLLQLQIPAPTGYVNDFAGVIGQAEREKMLGMIEQVRQASKGEIVVVTLRDLGGRPSIDVARDIGRAWRVGAAGGPGDSARNAGVVLLLKPGDRPGDGKAELAIASGSGAEGFVTDALAGRIRDAIGRVAVDSGSYAAGLVVGVGMLGQAYAREFGFELTGVPAPPAPQVERRGRGFPIILVVILFIVLSGIGRRGGGGGLVQALILSQLFGGGRGRGGWGGGGFGGGFGGGGFGGGGGGFGGFGGGGGFSGGGASGGF